jgi:hypothetical protein
MYNLPHLLGVAGSHGPGSPRRGRARSGRPTRWSPRAVRGSLAVRTPVRAPVRTRGRTHRCAPRAHPRACAQVCTQRCSRACAQVAGRNGDRRAHWPLSLTVPIRSYGSRSPRLRARARLTPSKTIGLHHAPRRCLHAFTLLLHLFWRFPCRCFSPVVLVVLVLVCRSSSPCPRTLLYPFPRCPLCISLLSS